MVARGPLLEYYLVFWLAAVHRWLPVRLEEVLLDPEDLVALYLLLVPLGTISVCCVGRLLSSLGLVLLCARLVVVVLLQQPLRIRLLEGALALRLFAAVR